MLTLLFMRIVLNTFYKNCLNALIEIISFIFLNSCSLQNNKRIINRNSKELEHTVVMEFALL